MKKQLVIDTDIGTDVDDAFALVYAIKHPEAEVKAITTVHGNPEVRAKIVRKLENILGVNIPIIPGEPCSQQAIEQYYGNFEHKILTEQELQKPLEQRPQPEYTSNTTLVAIGPLTNIAKQLQTNPGMQNIQNIYVMGSSEDSHNFLVDPEAKERVYAEPWNIWQLTKPDSLKIAFTKQELEKLANTPLGNFLYESGIRGMEEMERDNCAMYDVLTVSAALGEPYVRFNQTAPNRFVSNGVDLQLKDRIMEAIK